MPQLRYTGWSLINVTSATLMVNGVPHFSGTPVEITFDDINNGLIDDSDVQNLIASGQLGIQPFAGGTRLFGSEGLETFFSIPVEYNTSLIYTFSRSGTLRAGTWLKIGNVSSDSSPHAVNKDMTRLRVSVTNGTYLNTALDVTKRFEVGIYKKNNWKSFTLLHTVIFENARSLSEPAFTPAKFGKGTELCAKITAGESTNPVISVEIR